MNQSSTRNVAILLCTYNGEKFLRQQLDSYAAQAHKDWCLYVSDDGSKDATLTILEEYKAKWGEGRLKVFQGPCKGFAHNFMSLMHHPEVKADYYAFSDQDDIWKEEKLAIALSHLPGPHENALYCSASTLIDDYNREIGLSDKQDMIPGFTNALCQNIAGGNTMVITDAAREMILKVNLDTKIPYHDWWVYIIVTASGGSVYFDNTPTILYRQHGNNIVGANSNLSAKFFRVRKMFSGSLRQWSDLHVAALQQFRNWMTVENQKTFDAFTEARNKPFFPRLWLLKKTGIHRQTLLENMGLTVAAILRKI